jgi:hypothetical protein
MIIFNQNRFFGGGRRGVIQNASFRCALTTVCDSDGSCIVVSSFSGEWDDKNHEPVAEALLDKRFSRKQAWQIHDKLLKEMDQWGTNGSDLATAIGEVFEDAYLQRLVVRYQNNAPSQLTGPQDSAAEC